MNNITMLDSIALDKVSGGGGMRKGTWVYTIEEIEALPCFNKLKDVIKGYKRARDMNNSDNMYECETRMIAIARYEYEYRFSRELCKEFILKYLPLV